MKNTMKKTAIFCILLCLCMVASLVVVPAPKAAAAESITPRVLEGVYSVTDGNDVEMYIMTFDNGKLTIKAVDEDPYYLAGEYSYTADSARVPQVEGEDFSFSTLINFSNPLSTYALYIKGVEDSLTLTKTAELPGANPPAGGASKLDGVYNADLFGMTTCVMTFDNGKLTVEDRGMSGIQSGEYAYTVKDGVITVTKTDGSDCGFQITMDDSGNLSLKTPNVALPMALVKVAELPSAPKLDGVYNAELFGNVACVMTFDNGKLTVEDRGMSGIQNGEYAYTVKDGVITVTKTDGSDCGFQITMDDSGNLSLKTPNVALPMALVKVAELGGGTDTTDKAAADAVIAEINAIGTVTSDSKAAIEAARAGYDKLTDTQKKLVTNYETLTKAEKAFAAIPSTGDNTIFVFAILALSMTAVVVLVSRKRAF